MTSLHQLLVRQDLVLTRDQALSHGMTARAWEWKLSSGRWSSAVPGVAVARPGPPSPAQRAWVAVLHAGSGALLTGDALLHLIGFPIEPPRDVDVVVPHGRKVTGPSLPGGGRIRTRQTRAIATLTDPASPLPSVTRHVACLQAAAWATSNRAAEWRLAAMVQRRLSAVPLLRTSLETLPRLPRRALIREVLNDVELGAHAASELTFLRFLRRHGLPLPDELQVRTRVGRTTAYLDARYRKQRIAFEVDGAHHMDAATWEADTLRTVRLAVASPGDRVVRITTGNLRHDGPELALLLRQLLRPEDFSAALAG